MRTIDIGKLLKNRNDCPIRPDMSLSILGKELGPPEWWDFGGSDPFSALLGYGDFQIAIWAVENRVEVRRIGLQLWEASGGEPAPKHHKIEIAKRTEVDLSGYLPGADLDLVKEKLEREGIAFSEARCDDVTEVKSVLTLNDRTQLLFFSMADRIALAEIQFFSKLQGA
ncbi:hypothetical protein ABK249_29365 [Neorhizobium sp. Rsf11]|uniref:Uncharacterized protein n=2 Tax=Neorhizobium TaxID=1525371 RepID=A0ABV0MB08_9HYPH|nr:hypothetical protein [Neorhizobium petrolearium]MCC2613782.1 hypothetical protein [Neorhizobium petrolearium]WGI72092.1 hypothetical protein QEO92_28550 [Neorhizobium petrolearium]